MIKTKKTLLALLLCAPMLVLAHNGANDQDDDDDDVGCESHLAGDFPSILKPYAKLECDQFIVNPDNWRWRFPGSYFDRPYIPAFAPKPKKNIAGMRTYKQFSAQEVDKSQIPELHESKFLKIRSYKQEKPPQRLIKLKATNDLGDSMDVWFGLHDENKGWVAICSPVCAPEFFFLTERIK